MITIVGNGAIGNVLALQCQRQQIDYQLVSRSQTLASIHCAGLLSNTVLHPKIVQQPAKIQSGILILPLKAYQIVPCIEQLKSGISQNVSVILLHNGLGTHQQVKALLPDHNVAVATTSYGAFKPDKQHLEVTGLGETQAGWLDSHASNVIHQAQFSDLLPPCSWHQDITPLLWRKLAINAIINPLTAIFNVPNGELCEPQYQRQIRQLAAETSNVIGSKNMHVDADKIISNCLSVAKKTATNFSSMHQDIQNGRRTEIDYITGYIVQEAERLKVNTPFHQAIWQQIKKMEA